MESNVLRGYPVRLRGRGLSERTCSKFRIYKDGEQLRFHYCDGTGKVIAAKVRDKNKNFHIEGKQDGSFFGQHLCPSSGKRLVITEGELDAASCAQIQPLAICLLPNGAAGAKRAIQQNIQFLQGYEKLFFSLTMTMQVVKLQLMLLVCSLLAKLNYQSLQITRTHLTAYKQGMLKHSPELSGTQRVSTRWNR